MAKQDFVITELEAIGKDIEAIVRQEKDALAMEEQTRQEREERSKHGETIGVLTRRYDPNKFIPELAYIATRLRAVQDYITAPTDAHIHV